MMRMVSPGRAVMRSRKAQVSGVLADAGDDLGLRPRRLDHRDRRPAMPSARPAMDVLGPDAVDAGAVARRAPGGSGSTAPPSAWKPPSPTRALQQVHRRASR